ncbi:DUF1642 domain-containing protein [Enterococcus faecium]|uniref:DUF1642 domain-containing protein n=1 Tax=Enterococcus faecium TaxID=1352 RepID=UPI0018E9BFFD|nr:DUF1642 domain-containing protein [Enterococcus faecium]MCE3186513.1 DUF1642 domain-containing protein [Enterococcus faecium]MCU2174169.1 DUF1642 domain-containing protein [Enterococcus faecium]QQF27239.1 DUF1642 domain-containing protein [Enterococcus faecium]HCA4692189.1 DUF1642 domain-containing protein [Enterococcus faecium]HDG6643713.1 DUF1642 domain-containing protein [Enterococcus faecium]
MNTLNIKEGQTYLCTKAIDSWWTEGKEYKAVLSIFNKPFLIDDDGDRWSLNDLIRYSDAFKLKKEQPRVTLDEPQKPVVPKFVAEWFEENKDDLEFEIWSLCVNSYCSTTGQEMMNWIQQSENKPIETLIRMKEGYEVEKEPLYEVIIGDLYLIKKFNNRNDFCFDTSCSLCAWEKSAYQLTEAEIKAIDERYWPFAVPVEEVAEG